MRNKEYMQRCRHKRSHIVWAAIEQSIVFFSTILLVLSGTCLTVGAFAERNWQFAGGALCAFINCGIFFNYFLKCFRFESRKYQVKSQGICYSSNISGKLKSIKWDNIYCAGITAFRGWQNKDSSFQKVICIFLDSIPEGFENRILSYSYGLNNYAKLIIIDYDKELLDLLATFHVPITDFTKQQMNTEKTGLRRWFE